MTSWLVCPLLREQSAPLKRASDIAKGLLTLHDAKAVQNKTIELNRVILSAQAEHDRCGRGTDGTS
jgi:hypothetical protein